MGAVQLIATVNDARALGYCVEGLRKWFARRPDVSFHTFIREGVPVEWLRAQNDAQADKLADYAENRIREMTSGQR